MKVLILNENKAILKLIETSLEEDDHQIIRCSNALIMTELIKTHQPALIIMDLLISYMTGVEVIKLIRSMPPPYIKVIVLSSVKLEGAVVECFEQGVDDYIEMPLRLEELKARMARLDRYTIKALSN